MSSWGSNFLGEGEREREEEEMSITFCSAKYSKSMRAVWANHFYKQNLPKKTTIFFEYQEPNYMILFLRGGGGGGVYIYFLQAQKIYPSTLGGERGHLPGNGAGFL